MTVTLLADKGFKAKAFMPFEPVLKMFLKAHSRPAADPEFSIFCISLLYHVGMDRDEDAKRKDKHVYSSYLISYESLNEHIGI